MILTSRLRLRALTLRDLALFRALYCDAKTMRHIGRPLAPADARASLRATLAAARKPDGPRFFVIAERASCRRVGLCSHRPATWRKGDVELGIMLVPRVHGRGYAREALAALIRFAFAALPANAVWVQHSRANTAAARLNDALGFRLVRRRDASSGTCVWILRRPKQCDPTIQPSRGKTMSNVVGFLEQVGGNAAMRHANREQLLQAMRTQNIEPALQDAVLRPRVVALAALLGAREVMFSPNTKTPKPAVKKPTKKVPAKKPAKKAPAKRK